MKKVFLLCASLFAGFALYAKEWNGVDDFASLESRGTSYKSDKTRGGWSFESCVICRGLAKGEKETNPKFAFLGNENVRALTMNGNTSSVGLISSPIVSGLDSLRFKFAHPYKGDDAIDFSVSFFSADSILLKRFDIKRNLAQKVVADTSLSVKIDEDVFFVFKNNSPSQEEKAIDRFSIWNVEWCYPSPKADGFTYTAEGIMPIKIEVDAKDNGLQSNGMLFLDSIVDGGISSVPNVVCDGKANRIELNANSELFLPVKVEAVRAEMTLQPKTYASREKGWFTVVLPFDADTVKATINGETKVITPMYKGCENGDFWVKYLYKTSESNELVFSTIETPILKANTPYLMALPGSAYGSASLENAVLTFSANNVTVECAEALTSTNGYALNGSYITEQIESGYILDSNANAFVYTQNAQTTPFEAYILDESGKSVRSLSILFDDDATDCESIDSNQGTVFIGGERCIRIHATEAGVANIYTSNGALIHKNKLFDAGETIINGLEPGTYIINGQKAIVLP